MPKGEKKSLPLTFAPTLLTLAMLLHRLLNTPYPHEATPHSIGRVALFIGGIVTAVLLFLGPISGTGQLLLRLRLAAEYGCITAAMTAAIGLIALGLQTPWYREDRWTVGKEICMLVLHILLISLANLLYTRLRYPGFSAGSSYVQWLVSTALIGLVPVSISVIINMLRLNKRHEQVAEVLHHELEHPLRGVSEQTKEIRLRGENQQEWIDLSADQFLYAEAADNYVVVYSRTQQVGDVSPTANTLLRSTLKNVALQLEPWHHVMTCHRSYLVNLRQVTDVSGNAAGLKLTLAEGLAEIPVSRTYIGEVRQRLKDLH